MTNPTQINQGGAQNQERQPPEQTCSQGDNRTPDKKIGEVAYAQNKKFGPGGAGEPQNSKMEPEKQGGIGGP